MMNVLIGMAAVNMTALTLKEAMNVAVELDTDWATMDSTATVVI